MSDRTMSQPTFVTVVGIVVAALVLWAGVVVVGQIAAHLAQLGDLWGLLSTMLVVGGLAIGVLYIAARLVKARMTRV
jgi:hypothetical protein